MKHFFVINPCAGGENHAPAIRGKIKELELDGDIYLTRCELDATRYVDECCRKYPDETLRFYACGGDGTLNEVVGGAVGHANAEVGCFPCGSGNDYVKYFQDADFKDLVASTNAPVTEVDVMKVSYDDGVRYCVNAFHVGFEAEVCRAMAEVRRKPLIGGRMTYTTAIVKSLANGRRTPCRITVDGELWHEGELLLASLANGRYIGGGYKCAPRSLNNDGLLEVAKMKPISLLRFAKSIGYYKRGEHLDSMSLKDVVDYRRGHTAVVECDHKFHIGIDGELLSGTRFEIENLPRAIRFAVPNS